MAAATSLLRRNSGWLAETPKVNWPLSCLNDRGAARARSTRAQTNQSCLPFPSPLLFSVSPLQSQYSLVPSRHYKPNGRTDALCIFTTAASSSPSPNAISPASACNHRLLAQQDLTQIYLLNLVHDYSVCYKTAPPNQNGGLLRVSLFCELCALPSSLWPP